MKDKGPRTLRKIRIGLKRALRRIDRETPDWMRWLTPWGTSLSLHAIGLLVLALLYLASTAPGKVKTVDAVWSGRIGDDVTSLVDADVGGSPFSTVDSDEALPEPDAGPQQRRPGRVQPAADHARARVPNSAPPPAGRSSSGRRSRGRAGGARSAGGRRTRPGSTSGRSGPPRSPGAGRTCGRRSRSARGGRRSPSRPSRRGSTGSPATRSPTAAGASTRPASVRRTPPARCAAGCSTTSGRPGWASCRSWPPGRRTPRRGSISRTSTGGCSGWSSTRRPTAR